MVLLTKSTFCIRWTAFFLNLLIWLGGAVMLGLSVWVYTQETEYKHIAANDKFASAGYISISVFLFVVGFLGTWAILRLKPCLLKFYFSLIIFLFVAQLATALYLYFEQYEFQSYIQRNWNATDDGIRKLIQEKMKCCSMSPVITGHASTSDPSCYEGANKTNARLQDCYSKLKDWIARNTTVMATSAILVAVVQMFLLGSSCRLLASIESGDRMIRQIKVRPSNEAVNERPVRDVENKEDRAKPQRKAWAKLEQDENDKKNIWSNVKSTKKQKRKN